jgi:endonuclease YncB( thermonuclease family)
VKTKVEKPEPLQPEYQDKIVSVLDGDTIEVLHNTHPERIRLSAIDCPEKGQAFGNNAKQATSALVFGKGVMLQTFGKDTYGRTLADVRLLDGTHVNHTIDQPPVVRPPFKFLHADTLSGVKVRVSGAGEKLFQEGA